MHGFSLGEDVSTTQSRLRAPLFLLVLTGILFLVYTNGLNSPFQSDDERHIIINPNIDNPEFYLNSTYITYRHINNLTFALNYQWSQQNPFGYHLFNLIIHILTVILVFFITSLTIKNSTEWGEQGAMKIAAITALLFGLHPIQTETITYISGRPGGLAAFSFYFIFSFRRIEKAKINKLFLLFSGTNNILYCSALQGNSYHSSRDLIALRSLPD